MPPEVAPDGSLVEPLLRGEHGSLARFVLASGATTKAIRHRSVEEFWYVLEGTGELWRRSNGADDTLPLAPGVHARIAPGTAFQFRASAAGRLVILGTTMPPWPGPGEAVQTDGPWLPS